MECIRLFYDFLLKSKCHVLMEILSFIPIKTCLKWYLSMTYFSTSFIHKKCFFSLNTFRYAKNHYIQLWLPSICPFLAPTAFHKKVNGDMWWSGYIMTWYSAMFSSNMGKFAKTLTKEQTMIIRS